MRIVKMTATFGCLDGMQLHLSPGVNLLTMPNESGKSTWTAFVTAMFYGIDTTQRAAKGRLPDKVRYQPWSGKPMEGILWLEHNGKQLVLQRTSTRSKPMSVFRAYDPDTGLDCPELTAENCGRILLGAEAGVFRRSALISGTELVVTQDDELSRRLENLAAAGQAADSWPAARERLCQWKNRCRYHKTGLLPEAEAQLRQAEDARTAQIRAEAAAQDAESQAEARARKADVDHSARLQDAAETLSAAKQALERCAAETARLPDEARLQWLLARLELDAPVSGAEPPCPPALAALDAEQLLPCTQKDLAAYDRLTSGRLRPVGIHLFLAICCILGALAFFLHQRWLPGGIFLPAAACAAARWIVNRRHNAQVNDAIDQSIALLARYGVKSRDDVLPVVMARRDWLQNHARAAQTAWETELLVQECAAFAPGTENSVQAKAAVARALSLRARERQLQTALSEAQLRWQQISAAPADETMSRLQAEAIRLRAAAQQMQAPTGEQLNRLRQRVQQLQQQEAALELALEALDSAGRRLAEGYTPRLTCLAGEYLQILTQGRYQGLTMSRDTGLQLQQTATGLLRPLAAMSRGAQDQTWLALRLAMTKLLLPPDAPVILDDALLTFDHARTDAALQLLGQEGRQVLIFSCK